MSYILSIETATKICSVAVHLEGKVISLAQNFGEKTHAERIHALIQNVLAESKIGMQQLQTIAISAGPGSYTGLRIASALAKGLCFGLQIPLIAVDTLQSMALATSISGFLTCPMLDARRMEVYCALFDSQNTKIAHTEAKIIDVHSFEMALETNKIIFLGDGAAKCKDIITHKNAFFLDNIHPSAVQIGELAYKKFLSNQVEDIAYFEPHYLKEFYTNSKV